MPVGVVIRHCPWNIPLELGLIMSTLTSVTAPGCSASTIARSIVPNCSPATNFKLQPGGHASSPVKYKSNDVWHFNSIYFYTLYVPSRQTWFEKLGSYRNATRINLPMFWIRQVFTKRVAGGTDSPSPIVTSLTNAMHGTLAFGCS